MSVHEDSWEFSELGFKNRDKTSFGEDKKRVCGL
jgi:hypothetical protein